eukprot:768164-Hanusia_phi.AAC.2
MFQPKPLAASGFSRSLPTSPSTSYSSYSRYSFLTLILSSSSSSRYSSLSFPLDTDLAFFLLLQLLLLLYSAHCLSGPMAPTGRARYWLGGWSSYTPPWSPEDSRTGGAATLTARMKGEGRDRRG